MQNTKTKVAFTGTVEQEEELRAFIRSFDDPKSATMPIMQKAQETYGYLPVEVQKIIADELDMPLTEVYGIATFYSQFTLNPKGRTQVVVCMGTACYVKSASGILEKICDTIGCKAGSITEDGEYSVEGAHCVGACGLAPVVIINENVYGKVANDTKKINEILDKYIDKE
jgi:NADH:ubiquinone oxidoreductase subunit E